MTKADKILDADNNKVGTYFTKYKENGLSSLALSHNPGARCILIDELEMKKQTVFGLLWVWV